jgi:hypothetical protein
MVNSALGDFTDGFLFLFPHLEYPSLMFDIIWTPWLPPVDLSTQEITSLWSAEFSIHVFPFSILKTFPIGMCFLVDEYVISRMMQDCFDSGPVEISYS